MGSNAATPGTAGNCAQLQAWLRAEEAHAGTVEELDWLVQEARTELAQADDPTPMLALAEELAGWAAEEERERAASVALLHACRLAQDAGDVEAACDYAERALSRDPTDPSSMERLEGLLNGDTARLEAARLSHVELLEERVPYEDMLRVEAWSALATLRASRLLDLDGAIDAYQEALEIEATDATLEALAELYLRRDQAGDVDDAAEIYFQLAERADPEAAKPLLERALDLRPDHEGALEALRQLFEVVQDGVDEERLVARMVAYASVAPAGERRDSVIRELKARNSDVSELEEATGDAAPRVPAAAAPAAAFDDSADALAYGDTLAAPEALERALAATGSDSAVTSTVPYAMAVPARPSAGLGRPGRASPPPGSLAEEPLQAGATLPFHRQTPARSVEARARPSNRTPAPSRPNVTVPPLRPARNWIALAGSAGLLVLVALALVTISAGDSEPSEVAASQESASPARASKAEPVARVTKALPGATKSGAARAKPARNERPRRGSRSAEGAPGAALRPAPGKAPARVRTIGGVSLPAALVHVQGGDLDRGALMAHLEPVQRKLARCYRSLRARAPKAGGLLEYGWVVKRGGRVDRVRPLSGSLEARTVRLCGVRALRAARFPSPEGGAVEVRAVFDFSPPGR